MIAALSVDPALPGGPPPIGLGSLASVFVVLALMAGLAWFVRRSPGLLRHHRAVIRVETAVPLGERRSLVIVAVEGRRLLLGLTPAQVALVTELGAPSFADTLDRTVSGSGPRS